MDSEDKPLGLEGNCAEHDQPFRQAAIHSTIFLFVQILAYGNVLCVVVMKEWTRLMDRGFFGWWSDMDPDSTLYLLLLAVAPFCWCAGRSSLPKERGRMRLLLEGGSKLLRRFYCCVRRREWYFAATVAGISWLMSYWVSQQPMQHSPRLTFANSPPLIHDEYSYLIQAKTLLAGRTSFPSHPKVPELFDQMHVLNEGRFASRYFPGVGLWMAPFVALGVPHWGHWLAGSLATMFVFFAGRELGGNGVGILAGLLTALSPGMAIFSNLLLAHHPTLVALTLFLWLFLRMMRTGSWRDALIAGIGLSFAMLCRPLTAAGFALPFGVWFMLWLIRGTVSATSIRMRLMLTTALTAPILVGLGFQFAYNHAVTGNWRITPYQLYTQTYTPRHVYGFNNVTRGEQHVGPRVIEHYDRWAKNLTPRLALQNVESRLGASWQWTLGIVPLCFATFAFVFGMFYHDKRWCFVPAAILTLHVVHVPYWWDGIMHWHYVFETGPLWLLLLAGATRFLIQVWRVDNRPLMPFWWCVLIVVPLLVSYTSFKPFWKTTRLEAGLRHFRTKAEEYRVFHETIAQKVTAQPALVLVEVHADRTFMVYVNNEPGFQSHILFGRFRPGRMDLKAIQDAFPDRTCYIFRIRQRQLMEIGHDEVRQDD